MVLKILSETECLLLCDVHPKSVLSSGGKVLLLKPYNKSYLYTGMIVSIPICGYLAQSGFLGGWPSTFYVFGFLGVVWFVLWMFMIHDSPDKHPTITPQEVKFIHDFLPQSSGRWLRINKMLFWMKSCRFRIISINVLNNFLIQSLSGSKYEVFQKSPRFWAPDGLPNQNLRMTKIECYMSGIPPFIRPYFSTYFDSSVHSLESLHQRIP